MSHCTIACSAQTAAKARIMFQISRRHLKNPIVAEIASSAFLAFLCASCVLYGLPIFWFAFERPALDLRLPKLCPLVPFSSRMGIPLPRAPPYTLALKGAASMKIHAVHNYLQPLNPKAAESCGAGILPVCAGWKPAPQNPNNAEPVSKSASSLQLLPMQPLNWTKHRTNKKSLSSTLEHKPCQTQQQGVQSFP